jgi:hypothetical protein
VLEPTEFQGQAVYKDVNKMAWWEAARTQTIKTSWGSERAEWHDVEIGVTELYIPKGDFFLRRQIEAVKSLTGYTFEDGSTVHQVGEDELTRLRVSNLVACQVESKVIYGENYMKRSN